MNDQVSHTSDHFETCEKLARQIIRDGLAYMDNTDQETMQVRKALRAVALEGGVLTCRVPVVTGYRRSACSTSRARCATLPWRRT